MYRLVESIRIQDGEPLNIERHQRRVDRSYRELFGLSSGPDIRRELEVPRNFRSGIVKCRFLYCKDGAPMLCKAEFADYKARKIETLKLVFADKIEYRYKYTDRSELNALFKLKGRCDDILIVKSGFITDAGSANIVFKKRDCWLTPSTPLLNGTERQYLIEAGTIVVSDIRPEDLSSCQGYRLINAMLPFDEQITHPIDTIII